MSAGSTWVESAQRPVPWALETGGHAPTPHLCCDLASAPGLRVPQFRPLQHGGDSGAHPGAAWRPKRLPSERFSAQCLGMATERRLLLRGFLSPRLPRAHASRRVAFSPGVHARVLHGHTALPQGTATSTALLGGRGAICSRCFFTCLHCHKIYLMICKKSVCSLT